MKYDLVIRNGTVVDGTGFAPVHTDVGVVGDRIAFVGRIRDKGVEEIDADGHAVTPGFVDGHTHMDAQVFWDPYATSASWHGTTTMVMGNCGFTLAPAAPDARALVVRNLERAEGMDAEALATGISSWTWETFPEYIDAVDAQPKVLNYAANIGHSALRTWAMGERAFEGPANDDDLARMEQQVRDSMAAGALGFTTSRAGHETSDDRPVASRLATWEEVHRLVAASTADGNAIFQLAPEHAGRSDDPDVRSEWFGRLRDLTLDTGAVISLPVGPVDVSTAHMEWVDRIANDGGRIFGLSHSRGVGVLFSFETELPYDGLPEWRELRAKPLAEQQRLLRDPELRARLVRMATEGDYGRAVGAEVRKPEYDAVYIMTGPLPPYVTVADEAKRRGMDPTELVIQLAVDSDMKQIFVQPLRKYSDENILRVMKHPRMVMSFSDNGAHVNQVVDCSIMTHLLAYWVREREEFTLEEAVRMITLAPATAWGFADRGLVREGFAADLNVFDPATVGPVMPEVVHDFPAETTRFIQRTNGFKATIVGGQITVRDGEHTGALPGRFLRSPQATTR